MGVSPHFLKYYEETGILKPDTQENRYRFYNMWDASVILECKRMKNMGFSVKESHKIVTDSTADDLEQMLQEHEKSLSEELTQKQQALEALRKMRADLRLCRAGEWQIRTAGPVWFLPHTLEQQFVSDAGTYTQLDRWVDAMPLVRSTLRLTWNGAQHLQPEWGFSISADQIGAVGLQPEPPAILMPARRIFEQYTCYPIHRGSARDDHTREDLRFLEHIRRLNLVPGSVILKEVVSYTLQDNVRQAYCILRVPVEEP